MLKILRLRFQRWITRNYAGERRAEELSKILSLIEQQIELLQVNQLLRDALKYDIDLTSQEGLIVETQDGRNLLTAKGRSTARKLIHEEKERRFQNVARWVQLFTPLITSLAGLLGIIRRAQEMDIFCLGAGAEPRRKQ